jgi:hypothetical protein
MAASQNTWRLKNRTMLNLPRRLDISWMLIFDFWTETRNAVYRTQEIRSRLSSTEFIRWYNVHRRYSHGGIIGHWRWYYVWLQNRRCEFSGPNLKKNSFLQTHCDKEKCKYPKSWGDRLHKYLAILTDSKQMPQNIIKLVLVTQNAEDKRCDKCNHLQKTCEYGIDCRSIKTMLTWLHPHFPKIRTLRRRYTDVESICSWLSELTRKLTSSRLDDLKQHMSTKFVKVGDLFSQFYLAFTDRRVHVSAVAVFHNCRRENNPNKRIYTNGNWFQPWTLWLADTRILLSHLRTNAASPTRGETRRQNVVRFCHRSL